MDKAFENFQKNFRYTLVINDGLIWPMEDGHPVNDPDIFKEIDEGLKKEREKLKNDE